MGWKFGVYRCCLLAKHFPRKTTLSAIQYLESQGIIINWEKILENEQDFGKANESLEEIMYIAFVISKFHCLCYFAPLSSIL